MYIYILNSVFQSWQSIFLLFAGWENISMVLERQGKTPELKLRVNCSSWTEDRTQFILHWTNYDVHYSSHGTTISKDFRILQINFLRQRWPEKESQSLSLIYKNSECSLDLVFPLLDLKPIISVNCNLVNVKFRYQYHIFWKLCWPRSAETEIKLNAGILAWQL